MYYPYTAGVVALSHFYFNSLYSPSNLPLSNVSPHTKHQANQLSTP
ncbi:hypothetical protein NEISICOT_02870 [Neisseria sicca ATCC 29256]|uniref:Uncharacterized protein n=1 Tax=Neisseria sicca ATCC 29256 TaxID=547045 RepID=C6M8J7_NEISI|nr:hypothetical protein NEISICOT_02870 [Neisseria sicca ATCC 29256]